jgi:hypothetical protein
MSVPLIWIVACVYLTVAWEQYRKGDPGMALTWFAYSLANVGLAWSAK